MRKDNLAELIASHQIIVCVGSGGVGKTTTAASLALWGALQGRHTAVVTIDPARRLADCLGIDTLRQREVLLPAERFAPYHIAPSGTLTALMIDQQGAWDATITRYAPTEEIRDRILANRFYQGLSRTFAGSHEYMALETLAGMVQRGTYDLIVVDTPPMQQSLDFLAAPQRLQRFLDSQARKWFLQSSRADGWRAVSLVKQTTAFILKKIEEATGISSLHEITEFFSSMQQMFDDFGVRFQRVSELLISDNAAFVLVVSPDEEILAEAETFRSGLTEMDVILKGVIVNRVHERWEGKRISPQGKAALTVRLRSLLRDHLEGSMKAIEWAVENFLAYQAIAVEEAQRLKQFTKNFSAEIPVVEVPILPALAADFGGLLLFHQYLFPTAVKKRSRMH
jgi:anion-transporting  ArsA/GET3 family ATPase